MFLALGETEKMFSKAAVLIYTLLVVDASSSGSLNTVFSVFVLFYSNFWSRKCIHIFILFFVIFIQLQLSQLFPHCSSHPIPLPLPQSVPPHCPVFVLILSFQWEYENTVIFCMALISISLKSYNIDYLFLFIVSVWKSFFVKCFFPIFCLFFK